MKQTLQLKLSQQLTLTPQLQQAIKLLQMSTLELDQEIERMLEENPLLEREEGDGEEEESSGTAIDAAEAHDPLPEPPALADEPEPAVELDAGSEFENDVDFEREWDTATSGAHPDSDDEGGHDNLQQSATSLREHLLAQLALLPLRRRDRALVQVLIEALDERGYLTQSLDEVREMLPEELDFEAGELAVALRHLQRLDPVGVGARDLAECLVLQLDALPPDTPQRDLARRLAAAHLDLLAARDFARLKRLLHCEDEALREARELIRRLDPRPGLRFSADETRYIVPDVIVRKLRGAWQASINPGAVPRLRVNNLYADILRQERNGRLSGQVQEARWLIKNIQQRFDTILRVAQAIVDTQRDFFEQGEVGMRPLTLHEIAGQLDLHESTVSRVTTQKFMATPRGIFELKYFFGSHVATDSGGACSATAIRALIRKLVAEEDPKKPLSDSKIADMLGQQGIVVARRTIAKYREAAGVPAAHLRKSI